MKLYEKPTYGYDEERKKIQFPPASSASRLAPDEEVPCVFGYLASRGLSSPIVVTLHLLPSEALMTMTPSCVQTDRIPKC
ncbi:hypothetical protein SFRURICE_002357 [Spodoptera frugiperda]|nr:hypothetical protein SFRURICE_002357 [Spodoptera frugiperda]